MKTTRTLLIAAMTTVSLALTQPVSAEHHHEHIAMNTEKKLINIELDVLLEKFAELTKRVHQLDLKRISMEADIDFESNEAEQAEKRQQHDEEQRVHGPRILVPLAARLLLAHGLLVQHVLAQVVVRRLALRSTVRHCGVKIFVLLLPVQLST